MPTAANKYGYGSIVSANQINGLGSVVGGHSDAFPMAFQQKTAGGPDDKAEEGFEQHPQTMQIKIEETDNDSAEERSNHIDVSPGGQ